MQALFHISGAVAVVATILMLTRLNAVHALLYLIVSLLAVSIDFWVLGAPFVAALEIIIYAGAIMVLFVFVVMMLNLGERAIQEERGLLSSGIWTGPAILAGILIVEVGFALAGASGPATQAAVVSPKEVGASLLGPYVIGVELASFLLMAGLVGAYHLGRRSQEKLKEFQHGYDSAAARADSGRDSVLAGSGRSAGAP